MDLSDPREREGWRAHLGGIFTGRKVMCGIAPLAALNDLVGILASVGADKPLLVATSRGAGPVPSPDEADVVTFEVEPAATMTEDLRRHNHLVRNLPDRVRRRVEDYDPDREAVWCVGPFIHTSPIDGRAVVGGRAASWAALEDKLLVEEIWAAVGYPASDARVVAVDEEALRAASAELDLGHGVVWSGDARDGFNGGGEFVRWVVDAEERSAAFDFFKPRCDRVRVMPFLEGVPCSIHGIVLHDGTAAFRPLELATLRDESRSFVFGGQGTFWDPADGDREQMRDLVRRTGEHLRARVGYRGAFGIDGVLTSDGFRPTELNPRFSGGMNRLARAVDFPIFSLLQFNLAAGRDPRVTVEELESWALTAMDRQRICTPLAISEQRVVDDSQDLALSWDGSELARSEEPAGITLTIGPAPTGTFSKLSVEGTLHVGDRMAPLNAALMRFLDKEFGTTFGAVEAAPDVRPVRP
ncbi:MAG: hypothetical protein ACRDPJ_12180 [Nocardioidaceae bacterium]